MKPEIKTQWLAALRSGKYQQTRCRLRDSAGFCCLGVLCDIVAPNKWKPLGEEEQFEGMKAHDGNLSGPTPQVREMSGLSSKQMEECVRLNDVEGRKFADIADYIEANF